MQHNSERTLRTQPFLACFPQPFLVFPSIFATFGPAYYLIEKSGFASAGISQKCYNGMRTLALAKNISAKPPL
jgi:hypothetical protein